MPTLERVYEIVRQQPALPIEVASKLGVDSIIAKAYLTQLVDVGKLKSTQETIGNVPVYFIPGQEMAASAKIKKLLETTTKPTAKNFAAAVPQSPEIEKKRADFKARLEEIEKKEKELELKKAKLKQPKPALVVKPQIAKKPEVKPIVAKPVLEERKPVVSPKPEIKIEVPKVQAEKEAVKIESKPETVKVEQKIIVPPEEKPKTGLLETVSKLLIGEESPLVRASLTFLFSNGAEVLAKELKKRGKEAVITANIPSSIGPIRFLVFVVNKKTISESDLIVAYNTGQEKKVPVIVMSSGKLTKGAHNYLNATSGVVKYKQLQLDS